MKQVSLIIGVFAIIGMLVGFIPCLGWLNWINIPIAAIGIVLGFIAYNQEQETRYNDTYDPVIQNKKLPIGLILCGIAFTLGVLRLYAGGGLI